VRPPQPSSWAAAYRWMARSMRERLGPPHLPGQWPIWCWCQWRGVRRRMPDLRHAGHLPQGTQGVRLELQLDAARVLQSDFELWHYALNGWYLPGSLQDEIAFDAHPDRRRIEPSWQRMFDLDWNDRRYRAAPDARSIQGVCWEIRPADVVRSTSFVAR
ncbi:MAG TPA: DUF3841 domain-containing protein, partial [Steroidobacteraceae bacterium]